LHRAWLGRIDKRRHHLMLLSMVSVADSMLYRAASRIVVEVFVACVLNLIMLIGHYAWCSITAALGTSSLFCFTYQTYFVPQHGGVYLVTIDGEFSDITAPYLYVRQCHSLFYWR